MGLSGCSQLLPQKQAKYQTVSANTRHDTATAEQKHRAALVFLEDAEGIQVQPFADYSDETGWAATISLGMVDFDASTRTLHNYVRFRGLGDCGSRSDFQWNGYGFKLLRYAYKACSDEPPGEDDEIGDFPIIYEAK